MSEVFLTFLNMSLTGSYVIFFVILIRLLLKKAPKVISYALWGVVAFRLIVPFSFESIISLLPRSSNTTPIPHDIIYQQSPRINSGLGIVDTVVSDFLPAPTTGASVNPLQIYVEIGAYIWIIGIIALLVYSLVSVLRLKNQLKSAELIEKDIFEAEILKTPFVLGLIRPKIYLPSGLNDEERTYILRHEETHIRRKDHIIKALAFLTLSLHWFNPLVWIAFILMSRDMELSCDERVLKEMDSDIKKPYASSLLSLATKSPILNGGPLAFGEGNVKVRIKNVLNYKRPKFWVVVITVLAMVFVFVGLMTNPKSRVAFSDSTYGVKEILYQAPLYSFAYTLDTTPEYSISSDNILYSKNIGSEYWVKHNKLYKYEVSREDLSSLFMAPYTGIMYKNIQNEIDQVKYIYRADANDGNRTFYLVIQQKSGDVLLAVGYDSETNKHIRWLFELEKTGNRSYSELTHWKAGYAKKLWDARTEYIGDNSAVGNLIYLLPVPEDVRNYSENADKLLELLNMTTIAGDNSLLLELEPTTPELSLDQSVGADMVELDYASDDIIIFHDYFGLFVYDLNEAQLDRSLDLKPINCHYTQGDYYCEVTVSEDGNAVILHPISSENMFIYSVTDNTLKETIYEPNLINNPFKGRFLTIDEVVDQGSRGQYSYYAVEFSKNDYGYIYTEDGTLGSLVYVRGDLIYKVFDNPSGTYTN